MDKNNIKVEGYWWSKQEPNFPKPEHSEKPFNEKEKVIARLKIVQERTRVVHYKGISTCRCCDTCNGSSEYFYKNWKWPEGLLHYIDVHNIKPSDDFLEEVLSM